MDVETSLIRDGIREIISGLQPSNCNSNLVEWLKHKLKEKLAGILTDLRNKESVEAFDIILESPQLREFIQEYKNKIRSEVSELWISNSHSPYSFKNYYDSQEISNLNDKLNLYNSPKSRLEALHILSNISDTSSEWFKVKDNLRICLLDSETKIAKSALLYHVRLLQSDHRSVQQSYFNLVSALKKAYSIKTNQSSGSPKRKIRILKIIKVILTFNSDFPSKWNRYSESMVDDIIDNFFQLLTMMKQSKMLSPLEASAIIDPGGSWFYSWISCQRGRSLIRKHLPKKLIKTFLNSVLNGLDSRTIDEWSKISQTLKAKSGVHESLIVYSIFLLSLKVLSGLITFKNGLIFFPICGVGSDTLIQKMILFITECPSNTSPGAFVSECIVSIADAYDISRFAHLIISPFRKRNFDSISWTIPIIVKLLSLEQTDFNYTEELYNFCESILKKTSMDVYLIKEIGFLYKSILIHPLYAMKYSIHPLIDNCNQENQFLLEYILEIFESNPSSAIKAASYSSIVTYIKKKLPLHHPRVRNHLQIDLTNFLSYYKDQFEELYNILCSKEDLHSVELNKIFKSLELDNRLRLIASLANSSIKNFLILDDIYVEGITNYLSGFDDGTLDETTLRIRLCLAKNSSLTPYTIEESAEYMYLDQDINIGCSVITSESEPAVTEKFSQFLDSKRNSYHDGGWMDEIRKSYSDLLRKSKLSNKSLEVFFIELSNHINFESDESFMENPSPSLIRLIQKASWFENVSPEGKVPSDWFGIILFFSSKGKIKSSSLLNKIYETIPSDVEENMLEFMLRSERPDLAYAFESQFLVIGDIAKTWMKERFFRILPWTELQRYAILLFLKGPKFTLYMVIALIIHMEDYIKSKIPQEFVPLEWLKIRLVPKNFHIGDYLPYMEVLSQKYSKYF